MVGCASCLNQGKIDFVGWKALVWELDKFRSKLGRQEQEVVMGEDGRTQVTLSSAGAILKESEFRFLMLSSWSLFEAMYYSNYVASRMSVFKGSGEAKLKEMLAKMGIPLEEAKQPWPFMKPQLRSKVKKMINAYKAEYSLQDLEIESFKMVTGFNSILSCFDVACACQAILDEDSESGEVSKRAVAEATDALMVGGDTDEEGMSAATLVNGGNIGGRGLSRGVKLAKTNRVKIIKTAVVMVEKSEIVTYKHFRFAYIHATSLGVNGGIANKNNKENAATSNLFGSASNLAQLATFLMDIHRENGKWKGRKAKPLILLAERPEDGMYLVGAYNCLDTAGSVASNRFGLRFEMAAQQCGSGPDVKVVRNRFENSTVEVPRKSVQNFVQQLHLIMEQ